MRNVWNFFFGSLRRTGFTLAGIFVLALAINPSLGPAIGRRVGDGLLGLVSNLLASLAPLFEPALTLLIIILAFGWMWKGVFGKKGGSPKGR